MDKPTLLSRMREGHDRWSSALAALSDDDLAAAAHGEWTKKDLVAHVEFWQARSAAVIDALTGSGDAPPEAPTDELNARAWEGSRERPAPEVRTAERASFEELVAKVEALPDDVLVDPARFPRLRGDAIADMVAADTFQHYEEHLPHLTTGGAAG